MDRVDLDKLGNSEAGAAPAKHKKKLGKRAAGSQAGQGAGHLSRRPV